MSELSLVDRNIIQQYPLANTLDNVRDVLRKAEDSAECTDDKPDFKVPANPRRLAGATELLLVALRNHEAAFNIRSNSRESDLNTELQGITCRISREFNYEPFRPLVILVLQGAPDFDIWTAVLNLISDLARKTPPTTSTLLSINGTPFRSTSATQSGTSEQTRKRLLQPLQDELSGCTYERTEGFFEKYFDGKAWLKEAEDIYKRVKKNHVRGRWKDFPSKPSQDAVWKWWDNFQQKHLSEASGKYYTTESKAKVTGIQADRQLDVLLMHRKVTAEVQHHAKHYRVVGELTASSRNAAWKAKFLQLATYVRDVFSAQPLRRFVHGFLLFGTVMELLVFDRSGAYCSHPFDIHDEPRRFIRVIAGYALMSDPELGVDETVKQDSSCLSVTVTNDSTGQELSLSLKPNPIAIQRAIVTRGTCCYLTEDRKSVVKFSWASVQRRPEADHLRSAQEDGVKGVPRLLGSRSLAEVADLRSGLTFVKKRKLGGLDDAKSPPLSNTPRSSLTSQATGDLQSLNIKKRRSESTDSERTKKSRSDSVRSALYREVPTEDVAESAGRPSHVTEESFRNRKLTCLAITPAGRPLSQFRTPKELLEVFRDTIKQHKSLLVEAKTRILHRDISENNIIITEPKENDGYSGMLIDYDLAVRVNDVGKNEQTEAGVMTGTLEYIAVELLEGALHDDTKGVEHTYRHDLESFFYVFLSICVRYGFEAGMAPAESPLSSWYTGKLTNIATAKRGHMDAGGFRIHVLTKFSPAFECLKGLAMSLRDILFHEGSLFTGTPDLTETPPAVLYDSMIRVFDDTIDALKYKDKMNTTSSKISAFLTEIEDNKTPQYKSWPPMTWTEKLRQPRVACRKRKLDVNAEPDAKGQKKNPASYIPLLR